MVSIMPGMENFAPERTLTSRGFSPLPSFWPCNSSSFLSAASIWRSTSAETPLVRMYSRQASVWMVKPGGTGNPALVISARPAPLPPSTSFILPLPSALPPPKKYTYFTSFLRLVLTSISVSGRVVVAMMSPLLFRRFFGFFAFGYDFGEVRNRREFLEQCLQKREPVGAQLGIFGHHHHFVEEMVDHRPEFCDFHQHLLVVAC